MALHAGDQPRHRIQKYQVEDVVDGNDAFVNRWKDAQVPDSYPAELSDACSNA